MTSRAGDVATLHDRNGARAQHASEEGLAARSSLSAETSGSSAADLVLRPGGRLVAATNARDHVLALWRVAGAEARPVHETLVFAADEA